MDIPDEQVGLDQEKIAMDVRGSNKQGIMTGLKGNHSSNNIEIDDNSML